MILAFKAICDIKSNIILTTYTKIGTFYTLITYISIPIIPNTTIITFLIINCKTINTSNITLMTSIIIYIYSIRNLTLYTFCIIICTIRTIYLCTYLT